ncbi:DUF3037 domain-containing protein [Bacteroides sp.]|uniref:DUF3037 domain-containing protein n=1 Tax=Bacteroides sp. TaxID=29523 RepID=UPI0025C4E3A2|nr:DUF3037 domain-containing protein [Bacteroides sp.]
MPEKHLYEYAVIRIVPKVEREEFMNVGVILFSKQADFIKMRYEINENRLRAFSPELDMESFREHMEAFSKVCSGHKTGGTIALLDIPERFRWLTALRSSCIQTSRPHVGFSVNLEQTLNDLFQELVE